MRSSQIASVPILFMLAACVNGASGSRATPAEQAAARPIPATEPTSAPVSAAAPAAPPTEPPRAAAPAEITAPAAASAATPAPTPTSPRANSTTPATGSAPPAAKPSTTAAKVTAPAAAAAAGAPSAGSAANAATPARTPSVTPALDLKGLEQRLRDTHAIGVFTKLTLKNQVDDLLTQFKTFHQGRPGATLTQLRQEYEVLLLKVITLLQNDDPSLANAVSSSRDAIWGVLTDPQKFANI